MNKSPELICDIKNFEGLYAITEDYEIWSYPKQGSSKQGMFLRFICDKAGYFTIILCKAPKIKNCKIHRLIAEHLIPNPLNLPCINHLDGNKQNNYPSNLEWCTNAQNMAHAKLNGLMAKGEKHGLSKLTEKDVLHVRYMLEAGLTLKKIAAWFQVGTSTIFRVKHKTHWKCLP